MTVGNCSLCSKKILAHSKKIKWINVSFELCYPVLGGKGLCAKLVLHPMYFSFFSFKGFEDDIDFRALENFRPWIDIPSTIYQTNSSSHLSLIWMQILFLVTLALDLHFLTPQVTIPQNANIDSSFNAEITHRQNMASAQLPATNSLPSGEHRRVWISTPTHLVSLSVQSLYFSCPETLSRGLISSMFSPAFDCTFDHLKLIRAT